MLMNNKTELTQRDIMVDWVAQNHKELVTQRVMFEKSIERFGNKHTADNEQYMIEELNKWLNQ